MAKADLNGVFNTSQKSNDQKCHLLPAQVNKDVIAAVNCLLFGVGGHSNYAGTFHVL